MLTVLSVAYPLAPVGPDAVGGAEQVLAQLDKALVERGHRSLVVACEGSRTAGKLIATPRWDGPLQDEVRARSAMRRIGRRSRLRWPAGRSISSICTGSTSTPICRHRARRRW